MACCTMTPGVMQWRACCSPVKKSGPVPLSRGYSRGRSTVPPGERRDQRISDVIRGWLGWCPQGALRKTRTFPVPDSDLPSAGARAGPAAPAPSVPGTTERRPEYRENILLLILLLGGFFLSWDLRLFAIGGIVSAIVVYQDAGTLHAGEKFAEESFFGEVKAWKPQTWAVWVFIGSLFMLAVYTFSRQEIYNANN